LLAVDDNDACQLMLQWVLDSDLLLPGDKVHLLHVTVRDATGSNHLPGADYFEQVRFAKCCWVVLYRGTGVPSDPACIIRSEKGFS
jgi:hypothetical protein